MLVNALVARTIIMADTKQAPRGANLVKLAAAAGESTNGAFFDPKDFSEPGSYLAPQDVSTHLDKMFFAAMALVNAKKIKAFIVEICEVSLDVADPVPTAAYTGRAWTRSGPSPAAQSDKLAKFPRWGASDGTWYRGKGMSSFTGLDP